MVNVAAASRAAKANVRIEVMDLHSALVMGNGWASLTSTLSAKARIAWAQAVVENDKVRRWASALTRLHAISDFAGTGH